MNIMQQIQQYRTPTTKHSVYNTNTPKTSIIQRHSVRPSGYGRRLPRERVWVQFQE